jgi:hypothetical protein
MSRGRRIAYYGLPMLFCVAVHWLALRTWFSGDDFAWLGLPLDLQNSNLFHVLFAPAAQGTVRTLSERLYFLVFSSIFGIEAPPFRIWAFLTQFANIVLLMQITRRLTGSALAGFLAPLIWIANASLAIAMGWSSAYNEIAFAFFLLLAFRLLLQYVDTGQRKYWISQWIVFILGFGALELNVMYPVLAAGYALCCARPYFRRTLWLFIPSILFTAAHFALVPAPTDAAYQMHFDASIFTTWWHYWLFALGAWRNSPVDWRPTWLGLSIALAITVALAWFAVSKIRRRDWLPAFLAGWLFVVILPVLPLRDHFTDYYVMVPVIGLAILGAWALAEARGRLIPVAIALAGLYFTVSIIEMYLTENFYYARAHRIKYLITAIEALPQRGPDNKILLAGVDDDLFSSCFMDDPFRLIRAKVYLAPGVEQGINPNPAWGDISRYVISSSDAYMLISQGRGKIYELTGRRLRDLTALYLPALAAEYKEDAAPKFVDVADSTYQNRLGDTWYKAEGHFRWMPKTATVKIAGPEKDGAALEITGYCPALVLDKGPLEVWFRADGVEIGKASLHQPDQAFDLHFPVPHQLMGRDALQLEIEVSRTAQAGVDPRPLGLIFGTFRMK